MAQHRKQLEICARCETPTWCYQINDKPICGACRVENFFEFFLYRPLGYELLPWIRKELRRIYAPVDIETGFRKINRVYEEIPKKNSKSTWASGLPLFHLMVEADEIDKPEAYGAASAKDQAGIVFRSAAEFVNASPVLRDRLKVLPSTKRILQRNGNGFYQVLSADGDVQDGIAPSLFVRDELHRWKTAKAKTLYDILSAGDVSRRESLGLDITTAGDMYESPICYLAHQRARRFLEGSFKSDTYHANIFAADEKKLKSDPNYWKTRECRRESNPSHEDNPGGFLQDSKILANLEELGEAGYKRYHENIWGQKEERWMEMDAWLKCGAPTRTLTDRKCWLGLDLSSTTDMTALVAVFPAEDGSIDILPRVWIPKGQITQITRKTHQDIEKWIAAGVLEVCDGPTIKYPVIRKAIDDMKSMFRVQEICYDPWNATEFIQQLEDAGNICIKVEQGPSTLSAAMKFLMNKTLEGEIRHGNHEVANWHMDCVSTRVDANANIAPDKSRLGRSGKRIDIISALVTALARWVRLAPTAQSAYGSLSPESIAI